MVKNSKKENKKMQKFNSYDNLSREEVVTLDSTIPYTHKTYNSILDNNNENMKTLANSYNIVLNGLCENLNQDGLSCDERKEIRNDIKDIMNQQNQKDTENKQFLRSMTRIINIGIIVNISFLTINIGVSFAKSILNK